MTQTSGGTITAPSPTPRRMTAQRWALLVIGVIVFIAVLYILMNYYTPYTGDAFVQRYVVQVAPLVPGRVTVVHVTDNAAVKAGDLLFELDARPFEYELRQAQSKLALATQAVAELKRDITMADAALADSRELQQTAQTLFDEMKKIRESGAGSYVEYITAVDRLETRKSIVRENQAALDKAKLALEAILDNEHALIRQAEAEVNMARWRLEQTRVMSPGEGYVTNLQLQPGATIDSNTPVMTFVDGSRWWIMANFNENSTARIKAGQDAEVCLRSHPGRVLKASVDSLGWGVERGQGSPSGALPAPDTSQVWIRPPQRLPVKLVVEAIPGEVPVNPRVGASVAVTIYTGRPNALNPLAALWQRIVSKLDFLY